jgi:hypothetical protein
MPAAFAILLAGFATPGAAQLEPQMQTGSHIRVKPEVLDPLEAGRTRKQFAQCVYARNPALVRALLRHSDPETIDMTAGGTAPPKNLVEQLGLDGCLSAQMNATQAALGLKASSLALRSLLLEEDYLAGNSAPPQLRAAEAEDTGRIYISQGDALARARAFGQLADCVTFADTASADALLRTMPESDQERMAARALAPVIGPCMTEGQTIKVNAAVVRTIAADGLWARYAQGLTPAVAPTK